MKNFNIDLIDVDTPVLERVEINGIRHYVGDINKGDPYPSVTSILKVDPESQAGLAKWRARVGDAKADEIGKIASVRGNTIHEAIENYLENGVVPTRDTHSIDDLNSFNVLRSAADKSIDNIRMIEGRMVSKTLRTAGTVDMIAEYEGVLSVVDWKTSLRPKKEEYVRNYFAQEAAYAFMFFENTGIMVDQIVTIIAVDEIGSQIFVEKAADWLPRFQQFRQMFDEQNKPKSNALL
jgi:genome maintenance exonuclease 1